MSKLHTGYCSYVEETKFIAGTESYRKVLEADVRLSGGSCLLNHYYQFFFSASNVKLYSESSENLFKLFEA